MYAYAQLLARVCKMDACRELNKYVSLEDSSFCFILTNFEVFSPEHVALLPTRMQTKVFLHLPVADVCKLEKTIAVEGIDMNQFWKEAIKEFNISECYACPSTKTELQQGQDYRHLYNEVLYRVTALWHRTQTVSKTKPATRLDPLLYEWIPFMPSTQDLLCTLQCYCGPFPPSRPYSGLVQTNQDHSSP